MKVPDYWLTYGAVSLLCYCSACGSKPQVHREAPEIVGQRTNEQGLATQRIVRETSYSSTDVLLTPEGPKKRTDYQIKWFLEEPPGRRREFPLMRSVVDLSRSATCWPVADTNLWLAAGIDPVGNGDKLYVVVFDEQHIIRTNVFNVVPKWKSGESEFELQSGNRAILVRTGEGAIKHNIK